MTHPNSDQHHHPPPVIMIISKVTSDHSCPRDIPNKTINTPPHKPKPSHNNARKFTRTPISSFFYARIETYVTGDLPVCFQRDHGVCVCVCLRACVQALWKTTWMFSKVAASTTRYPGTTPIPCPINFSQKRDPPAGKPLLSAINATNNTQTLIKKEHAD